MRLLYHFCLQPFSREVRVVLREKSLDFTLRDERVFILHIRHSAQRNLSEDDLQ